MTAIEQYRAQAETCLRLAHSDRNEHDRPLWVTLAQSWLQLAEHADRIGNEVTSAAQMPTRDPEKAESAPTQ
jgi:hypothetical protein